MIESELKYSTIKVTHRNEVVGASETFVVGMKVINGKIITQKLPDVSPYCDPFEFWSKKARKDGSLLIEVDQRNENACAKKLVFLLN